MEIKFENTINEYIELQLYLSKKDKKQKLFFMILKYFFIFFCIVEAIKYFITHDDLSRYLLLIFFMFIIFLWIIIVPKLIYNAIKKGMNITVNKNPNMLSRRIMNIFENKIIISDIEDNNKIEFNINDIYKVVKLKSSLYIFKDEVKVYAIINLNAFKNESDKNKFLTLLESFIEKNKKN